MKILQEFKIHQAYFRQDIYQIKLLKMIKIIINHKSLIRILSKYPPR